MTGMISVIIAIPLLTIHRDRTQGTDKVVRGGSFNYMTLGLRVYDRNFKEPSSYSSWHDVGFRCVSIP